ncbi:SPLICING FACTOR FOR U2 snRNP [Encephalitozoon cuniculi GB-M1]|uniref:SPLICING FACTOR FOR U2 snRNP n=1 Tax=Encephalitozoon cuniculi (strain GB-M1) TaxID=284813 RepID=Q8SQT5_ENCCU|nr:uncharacterized protein ECU11_1490 [Encephalitozoon cuniculi GB-M1]CAD26059.2 SPLICING FACTOR FOR U2 snRNP [Encephalitozoon cuniculi GB-M1]
MEAEIDGEYGFVHRMKPYRGPSNKRQRKRRALQHRYEELKLVVPYPEIFETEDATCPDPMSHNRMKGCSGVPVPRHWRSSSRRMFPHGYHKPRYVTPRHVIGTGIPELRRMMREREAGMSLRERIREKLHPRVGGSLVDQRILYEAFFSLGPRPYLSKYGEFFEPVDDYFEKKCFPGAISADLMEALGIDSSTPPPWLFNMQKHGMPPSYPDARIPGLNAPIPEGCSYGYQPRGWGEPLFEVGPETAESEVLQKDAEAIYNDENQYTRPVYMEDFEERVVVSNGGAAEEAPAAVEAAPKEDAKVTKRGKAKREKLYKSIKF